MPSAQRIAAFSHRVHKSHTVVSAAVMFHDVLKTTLASRKEFKSCEEAVEMRRFGFFMELQLTAPVFPSICSSGNFYILRDQRKSQHFFLLMFFVSSLWCEIKRFGRVSRNYVQFMDVIFRKWGFFKKKCLHWTSLISGLVKRPGWRLCSVSCLYISGQINCKKINMLNIFFFFWFCLHLLFKT